MELASEAQRGWARQNSRSRLNGVGRAVVWTRGQGARRDGARALVVCFVFCDFLLL